MRMLNVAAITLVLASASCGDEVARPTATEVPVEFLDPNAGDSAELAAQLVAERNRSALLKQEVESLTARVRVLERLMQGDVAKEALPSPSPPPPVDEVDSEIEDAADTAFAEPSPASDGSDTAPLVPSPEAGDPHLVTVYYGTDRAQLERGWWALLRPWRWPALVIVALFLMTSILRWLLHSKAVWLRRGLLLVRITCAGVALWLGLGAAQATALELQAQRELPVRYGSERRPWDAAPYEAGTCEVSIPPIHRRGLIERPELVHLEFVADPAKHFKLTDIAPLDTGSFLRKLAARVNSSPHRDAFLYIHGFNNTFEEAALRTAQIAHDLDFDGVPILFSWPSIGGIASYTVDENNVQPAVAHLERFLSDLLTHGGIERLHLVAHSMGSRALAYAILGLGRELAGKRLGEVILAAPDIDGDTFRELADDIARASSRVTLYASSRDPALDLSRRFHGGRYSRAGESQPPLVVPGVDTIDVTSVAPGHAYISASGAILGDVGAILKGARVLGEDIALRVPVVRPPGGAYWIFLAR